MKHNPLKTLSTLLLLSVLGTTITACSTTSEINDESVANNDQSPSSPIERKADPAFVHEETNSYSTILMHGFTVLVSKAAMEHPETTEPALELLNDELEEVIKLTPDHTHKNLRLVRIWIEHFNPGFPCACYHPGAQWLSENGYNTDKTGGIEITNAEHFVEWTQRDQPLMVLHELAHAYHDQVLGFDNLQIETCFKNAQSSGLYESVNHVSGKKKRHYAMSNSREYFAELTESYFGQNDFEPFTRDELSLFDPQGLNMIQESWGVESAAPKNQD
ncbi:MAG: hypothetical protein P1U42_01570 [Phycisphaerales bacterium]|nr:hypothetical protein [Phycisphaerales bacterium]